MICSKKEMIETLAGDKKKKMKGKGLSRLL
jgi:hypothetical protein